MVKLKKRNGDIVKFEMDKIIIAIEKAMKETELGIDSEISKKIAEEVYEKVKNEKQIDIEAIQDMVELGLMHYRPDVAKKYIIYRLERKTLREKGWDMTALQKDIYEKKYRNNNETFDEFLTRVSGGDEYIKKAIKDKKFMPAGRILAGRGLQNEGRKITYSNCFVAGTPVLTKDGYKPIEKVVAHEQVVTHMNRYREVNATMVNPYSEKLYEITTYLSDEPIKCTANHKFLVYGSSSYDKGNAAIPDNMNGGWESAEEISKTFHRGSHDFIKIGHISDLYPAETVSKLLNLVIQDKNMVFNKLRYIDDYYDYLRKENELKELDPYKDGYFKIAKNGDIYVRVKSINIIDLEKLGATINVYNISVEEDHSYVVDGLVAHNCYVLEKPSDNIESIFDTAKYLARTYSYGGGCGVNISNLRPRGSKVNNAARTTSGAVSFMDLYSMVTGLIGMKGRRGALMLNMDVSHPDIEDFINVKNDLEKVTFANISVNIDDEFMNAVKEDKMYTLHFTVEASGEEITKEVNARELFKKLAYNNWNMAEPGMLFQNRINNWHLMSDSKEFEFAGVNPCFTGDMKLLTSEGYKTFKELEGKTFKNIDMFGNESEGKVWSNGKKEIIMLFLSNCQVIKCTPDHRFLIDNEDIEAKDLLGRKITPFIHNSLMNNNTEEDLNYILYGYLQGDGGLRDLQKDSKHVTIYIGENDSEILKLLEHRECRYPSCGNRNDMYFIKDIKDELNELGFSAEFLVDRSLPSTFNSWTKRQKSLFINGMFCANGSMRSGYKRLTIKSVNKDMLDELSKILKDEYGIENAILEEDGKKIKFSNGTYQTKKVGTYQTKKVYILRVNEFESLVKFYNEIGFFMEYKQKELEKVIRHRAPIVRDIEDLGEVEEVFDFTEPNHHYGSVNGALVHNCAEEPLPKFGSCNLSSINLSQFVKHPFEEDAYFDLEEFKLMVKYGVRYLNNILDENTPLHPLPQQREVSENLRQIGLGIMGLADAFIKLGIEYGSDESIKLINKIGKAMINEAVRESANLAKESGPFPLYNKEEFLKSEFLNKNIDKNVLKLVEKYGVRNSQILTIAPTGSISTMIGTSGGIEPIFQVSYTRKTESLNGQDTYYKVYTDIVREYMDNNNIAKEEDLPSFIVTSSDLDYKKRIDVQSAWQQYIDASISSTVNVPNEFTVEEVEDLYMYAWEKGLKGITIYRDGCARSGILITDKKKTTAKDRIDELESEIKKIASESLIKNPDECPMCGGKMNHSGGCAECQDCGYSPCAV